MAQDFSPTEIFKRATAATLRAIAERDDVTVTFGPEAGRARAARGCGCRTRRATCRPRRRRSCAAPPTALALRLRYHDDAVHGKRVPGEPAGARDLRGASSRRGSRRLGARRMAGVAANLAAMLDEQYRRQGFERVTERTESTHGRGGAAADPRGADQERAAARGAAASSICGGPGSKARSAKDFGELDRADPRPGRLCAGHAAADPGSRPRSRRGRRRRPRQREQQGDEAATARTRASGEGATAGAQASLEGCARRRRDRGRDRTATPRPTAR